jgi:hypothetical protein
MTSNQESLHTLTEIRDLMERSSKFLSLSGLSGVFAGIFALIGAGAAYIRFKTDWMTDILEPFTPYVSNSRQEIIGFLIADGFLVLLLSLTVGIILSIRKARKKGLKVWNSSSKRLLISLLIPLGTGGVFCLAMLSYGYIWLVFPATLLFYGLAIVSASRFTYPEVFSLGISEILLGCACLFLTGYSLLFWSLGFGVLHIFYGLAMYNKYDRPGKSSGAGTTKSGFVSIVLMLLLGQLCVAQDSKPIDINATQQWYDKETIYLQGGNSFIKNNIQYAGIKALRQEFKISEGGMQLYVKSRRNKNIALVFSILGSAGTIYSLASGDRSHFKKFFWLSLGTGLTSSLISIKANNLRDQAVWLRNRDAILLMKASQ